MTAPMPSVLAFSLARINQAALTSLLFARQPLFHPQCIHADEGREGTSCLLLMVQDFSAVSILLLQLASDLLLPLPFSFSCS
jgi:hypothetical protein